MPYDNPLRLSYTFNDVDFGNGSATLGTIDGPANKRGRVVEMHAIASETFTNVTTQAFLRVGDGTDDDKFGELNFAALAAGAGLSAASAVSSLLVGLTDTMIEPADAVTVKAVAPTGGVPAGIADCVVTIDWF